MPTNNSTNEIESSNEPILIVGIGASAGGLDAFKRFFTTMPDDSGMAFVLLPHLSASHHSLMPELLSTSINMKVQEAQNDTPVLANHVYILPPDKKLSYQDDCLHLETEEESNIHWSAIENFLCPLAIEKKERAVAIILSGTGNHGIMGIREIKLNGGLILAQSPLTCHYNQMPINAIDTGLVDFILPPEEMPQALIDYAKHPYLSKIEVTQQGAILEEIQNILTLLRKKIKHDFSCYRKNMLLRRIQRRMSVCHASTLAEYYQYLIEHSEESHALCKDLLIGVTAFFRDPEAFNELEQRIVPELVAQCNIENPIRIWVPACASGEEAYSIAMLFHEEFEMTKKPLALQIFASDIDEESLNVARLGTYPIAQTIDLSKQRLNSFFVKTPENKYRVKKYLRDSIVFASHNLITDAPFSRVDLISCRNFLIYLQAKLQSKIINLFHFSLKANGYLMLGPSESIGRNTKLFSAVSKKWRIFKYIVQVSHRLHTFPTQFTNSYPTTTENTKMPFYSISRPDQKLIDLVYKNLLDSYAPAAVLINGNFEVLHFQGPTIDYLEFPKGTPSNDITVLVREGLRTRIRAAVKRAKDENQIITDSTARVKRHDRYKPCKITVRPIYDSKSSSILFLIVFEDEQSAHSASAQNNEVATAALSEHHQKDSLDESIAIRQLEEDLENTREDLQSNIEDLKASNEEVMSMNEELQSANEELETSKEELQSTNEELTTVNTELQCKLEELVTSNDDISNLLASTDIATLFLNRKMKIKLFNPATAILINLRKTDIGRAISDLSAHLANTFLLEDAQTVLDSLAPVERDIWNNEEDKDKDTSKCFLRRIVPYKAADNRISGVIITFIDITERYRQKQHLEQCVIERTQELYEREERLKTIMESAADAIVVIDFNGLITEYNKAAEKTFGYKTSEAIGKNINLLMPFHFSEYHDGYLSNIGSGLHSKTMNKQRKMLALHKDGNEFPIDFTISHVKNMELYIGIIRDLTEKTALEKAITEINTKYQEALGIELHDTLGQRLTGINLLIKNLKRKRDRNEKLSGELIEEIGEQLTVAIGETRRISHGLAPISLTPEGLQDALAALVEPINNKSNINAQFNCNAMSNVKDRNVAMQVYRIAQEALNNAVKYANAKNISLSFGNSVDTLMLNIQDDGQGFDENILTNKTGIGLHIMQYRANSIGAQLNIESTLGQGTTITFVL